MAHRSTQDAAQDVAPALVGGEDTVVDEERRGPGVLHQDAQRHVAGHVRAVAHAGDRLGHLAERHELVDVEDRVDALDQGEDALEAGAGVDGGSGQGDLAAVGLLVVLHEHEVPELEVALLAAVGGAALGSVGGALVEEDLAAGPAGAGVARLPEVVLAEPLDALGTDADRVPPDLLGVVVGEVHGDPQPLGVEAHHLGDQLPGPGDGIGLEVVAEAEVAEHLEERQVPLGAPDLLEVVVLPPGPHALLHGRGPLERRDLLTQEVGLERHHPRHGEQQRRVVGDERRRRHGHMAALDEEGGESAPQIACAGSGGHAHRA